MHLASRFVHWVSVIMINLFCIPVIYVFNTHAKYTMFGDIKKTKCCGLEIGSYAVKLIALKCKKREA